LHNKDLQGPDMADVLPAQPANVPLWFGPIEAGDTRRFLAVPGDRPARSKLGEPFQKLTRRATAPVRPGEVTEYKIHILATANQFKAGRRLCIEITYMVVPTGTGAMTDIEYIPYHVCQSETVTHSIYHDAEQPSHLLLPVIPKSYRPPPQRSRLQ
jgi:hypothetical protein